MVRATTVRRSEEYSGEFDTFPPGCLYTEDALRTTAATVIETSGAYRERVTFTSTPPMNANPVMRITGVFGPL